MVLAVHPIFDELCSKNNPKKDVLESTSYGCKGNIISAIEEGKCFQLISVPANKVSDNKCNYVRKRRSTTGCPSDSKFGVDWLCQPQDIGVTRFCKFDQINEVKKRKKNLFKKNALLENLKKWNFEFLIVRFQFRKGKTTRKIFKNSIQTRTTEKNWPLSKQKSAKFVKKLLKNGINREIV